MLKLQLSSSFRDPLVRLVLVVDVLLGSVTVSDGGGSYQVTLLPSERLTFFPFIYLSLANIEKIGKQNDNQNNNGIAFHFKFKFEIEIT